MNKRKFSILVTIVALVALAATLIPWPVPWNKTLSAVKLDQQGNELSTVQIPLKGIRWTSLLLADRLKVELGPIEGSPSTDIDTAMFSKRISEDFLSISIGIACTNSENKPKEGSNIDQSNYVTHSYRYDVYISEDYDRWFIHIMKDNETGTYYTGSISGKDSTQELWDYFGRVGS